MIYLPLQRCSNLWNAEPGSSASATHQHQTCLHRFLTHIIPIPIKGCPPSTFPSPQPLNPTSALPANLDIYTQAPMSSLGKVRAWCRRENIPFTWHTYVLKWNRLVQGKTSPLSVWHCGVSGSQSNISVWQGFCCWCKPCRGRDWTLWVTSAWLTGPPSPLAYPAWPCSDMGTFYFRSGEKGMGPFLLNHCPCARCSVRGKSHQEKPNLSGPPLCPQSFSSLQKERPWKAGRALCWGDAAGQKGRLGDKSVPFPISLPSWSGPLLHPGGHKFIWVPALYLKLAQLPQFSRTSRF